MVAFFDEKNIQIIIYRGSAKCKTQSAKCKVSELRCIPPSVTRFARATFPS